MRPRPLVFLSLLLFAAAGTLVPTATAHAAADLLMIDFDQGGSLKAGTAVRDVSGNDNDGIVRTKYGGLISPLNGGAADFPNPCSVEPCRNAMIEIVDAPSLDPGTASFEWGAEIRMKADETADGENVLQKGRWGDAGGQWKLQVDKSGGKPSCVVSGFRDGVESRVVLKSSIGIGDNGWHQITCRRTADGVEIVIDGVSRGAVAMPVVMLSSTASVTIGAKEVLAKDNDQFQGRLDDVFIRVI